MSVRVVVVDDSRLHREALATQIEADGTLEVVGRAGTVAEAVATVARLRPDVVTMDLELADGKEPLGGVEAIRRIVADQPVPILLLSAYAASRDDTAAIEALAAGAMDVFAKADLGTDAGGLALRRRLLVLSRVKMVTRRGQSVPGSNDRPPRVSGNAPGPVLALAASTGGPSALRTVLQAVGPGLPAPILVVQHIHPEFGTSFARWLGETSGLPTTVPGDGELLQPGRVHVAPARLHLLLGPDGTARLRAEPPALSVPSCDVLLDSVAEHAGPRGVGAVLTGMGDDGARGLLAMREAGGTTFAQDGASAVVDGMPKAARQRGAAQQVLPLDRIGPALADAVRRLAR